MVSKLETAIHGPGWKWGAIPLVAAWLVLMLFAPGASGQSYLASMTFDENCGNTVTFLPPQSGSMSYPCSLRPDPTQPGNPNVVTFFLPYEVGPGQIAVYEESPFGFVIGDVIRFTDICGDLFVNTNPNAACYNQLADRMLFYSLAGGTDLADTGLPGNLYNYQYSYAWETDSITEAFNFQDPPMEFTGTSGNASAPCDENCDVVPEPSMAATLPAALAFLCALRYGLRRRAKGMARRAG